MSCLVEIFALSVYRSHLYESSSLTLVDGIDMLSWNIGNKLPISAM